MSYKRRTKKLASIALSAGLVAPIIGQPLQIFAAEDSNKKITILHTNDMHGRFEKTKDSIGMDVLATIKKDTPNSILVDAGDAIHGLPFVTLSKGQDAVDLMNVVGYDFMVPGNHDFNYGYERLKELTLKTGEGKMRVLSSNVKKDGTSVFEPSYVKEINGVKVGFFGLSSEETAYKTNPNNVKGLEFTSPIESAKEEVKNLEEQGADVIVALSHVGTDESSDPTTYDIVKAVSGIDVVVDGHSHTNMPTGEKINDTLIVSTGDYLNNVGKVDIELSKVNGEYEVVKISATHITKAQTENIKSDSMVESKINEIKESQDKILDVKVGKTETILDGVRENVRSKETNLGNLITDAMKDETGADVAITNGGGIRASIGAGDITKRHITQVLPFGNFTVTKELTGAQIKEVLEHGVKYFGEVAGSFAHVSGIKFVVNPTKEVGSRVIDIEINGQKIDMNKKYKVATNDFISAGGDDYPCFSDMPTLNEFGALDETLEKYIEKIGTVNSKVEGRITSVVQNIVGNDRYETATKLSESKFETAENVIIVNSSAIADALSATPFAKLKDAPVLLTETNNLTEQTKSEISRLGAKNVYIIGGESVVKESVVNQLKEMNLKVERISGEDRYETSLEVAKKLGDISEIAVVNGETGLVDAVSIAPVAANNNMPILLVSSNDRTEVFDKYIKDEQVTKSYVIGQENAISKEIADKLPNAERLGGIDRNETNAIVIERFYKDEQLNNIFVAKDGMKNQDDLIDALAVGVIAAKDNAPVVIGQNSLSAKQEAVLSTKKTKMLTKVGGNGNEGIFNKIATILKQIG